MIKKSNNPHHSRPKNKANQLGKRKINPGVKKIKNPTYLQIKKIFRKMIRWGIRKVLQISSMGPFFNISGAFIKQKFFGY